jgi:hypothetical protein
MSRILRRSVVLVLWFVTNVTAIAGVQSSAIRETAEFIMKKFGKGVAGETLEQVSESTAKAVTKYGDECLPILRKSGHSGYRALADAGDKAPDIIKLYARKGDEAIWIISEPKKLAIFIKHGDNAADALIKHPRIAEDLIGKFGDNAVGAMNSVSRSGGQRLGMLAADGTLDKIGRQPELLEVIRKYGDAAMDFIWKNKGALTVASALTLFLANPDVYINGAKSLIVDPIAGPIARSINWTLIILVSAGVVFAPFIVRSIKKVAVEARSSASKKQDGTT